MKLDLVVRASTILTMDQDRPNATRMGVLHGRIVGFDADIDGCEARREADYGDAVIVPGFIDAHCHTTWWGLGLAAVDLAPARGLDELYALLEAEAARLAALPGGAEHWVNGTGFNHKYHGGEFPDIDRLDRITGDRPLYLRHVSGHLSITNTATLRLAGALEPGFSDPVGGKVLRDETGKPTGVVEEAAQGLIQAMLLPYSVPQIVEALDAATSRYAGEGITSFTEAGIGGGWIGHSPIEVEAYRVAHETGRLHARAQLMPALDALVPLTANAADLGGAGTGLGLSLGIGAGFGTDWVQLGPVKVFLDGSLLGTTAAVTEDYCGHPHDSGYLLDEPGSFRERVLSAYRSGWPVALHAIGDAAIDLALDLIEECRERYGVNRLPNRIEHFGISRPDQLLRAAAAEIAVTPQAGFIGPLGDQFATLVGPEREGWLYRGRSLVDAGVLIAGSSDLPVADNNILRGMQSAVDRTTENGRVLGGAAEGLTPEEALRTHTEWAARATGTLADRGTLTEGKLADFVALSASPLTAANLAQLDVLATVAGGETTFVRAEPGTNR